MTSLIPPLIGDGTGRYRIHIVGNSGAGKSTLTARLGEMLGLPTLHLDTAFWLPGWQQSSNEEFCAKVRAFIDASPNGWIIDGNYNSKLGNLMGEAVTDTIWLDPPFALYFPRILYRTFLRLLRFGDPCSPGCDERFSEVFFSKDSIIWWCLTQHSVVRKRETERMNREVEAGAETRVTKSGVRIGKRRRICGWGEEYRVFMEEIEEMVKSR